MIITSIPDFRSQYDASLGLLRLAWMPGRHSDHVRASAAQLLVLARQLEVRQLMLDMNTVPNIGVTDEDWLGTHWMPGLVALPLERLVLVMDGDQIHNQLVVNALHELVQPLIRFDAQYFSDSESALGWLTEAAGPPHLAQLLAEWATAESETVPTVRL